MLIFALFTGGITELAHMRGNVEGVLRLGYPLYVITLLGIWKVLGGIAIGVLGFPRLKEWAYAGCFFDMTGALVSHIACHDTALHIFAPAMMALLTLASWASSPQDRMLGTILPKKTPAAAYA
jgi:DoxX-like family